MKTVLTIAGSDCSGGAGIQADIKTISAHGLYAMSVITALTAQNTTGVQGVLDTPPEFVAKQLDCVFQDIPPNAVKIGMVSSAAIIRVIGQKLRQYRPESIVVDPVMISTSGSRLIDQTAVDSLVNELFPLASVITPNLPEAGALCGFPVQSRDDMERAGAALCAMTKGGVLLKGGHLNDTADDLLVEQGRLHWFRAERVDNPNTHGTGCTLSSAIACGLAMGRSVEESVQAAKEYLTGALRFGLDLGKGSGPLHHMYSWRAGR